MFVAQSRSVPVDLTAGRRHIRSGRSRPIRQAECMTRASHVHLTRIPLHLPRTSHACHTPPGSRHARVGGRVDNRCRRWGARARRRRTGETPVRRQGPDGTEPTRARVLSGPEMAHPRSCPRPVGGFTRVLRSPDLKWLVRFCQTGPVAPRRRGRSRNSLGRAKCPGSLDKTTVHLPDSRGNRGRVCLAQATRPNAGTGDEAVREEV